jgi:hypothetical protein
MLEIEPGELMAEYRPSLTPEGRQGLKAEIFLYDTLPGGAGFASQLVEHGAELFQRALQLLKACPENCDASCYRCLRSFKNKFEHGLLDRHVAAELLEYLLTGSLPQFDTERMKGSTAMLYADLLRQSDGKVQFDREIKVSISGYGSLDVPIVATCSDGSRYAVALSGPLTDDYPADPQMMEVRNRSTDLHLILVNELLVRGNLPAATREVQQSLSA